MLYKRMFQLKRESIETRMKSRLDAGSPLWCGGEAVVNTSGNQDVPITLGRVAVVEVGLIDAHGHRALSLSRSISISLCY